MRVMTVESISVAQAEAMGLDRNHLVYGPLLEMLRGLDPDIVVVYQRDHMGYVVYKFGADVSQARKKAAAAIVAGTSDLLAAQQT